MTSIGFTLPIDRFEIDCFSMFNCPVARIVLRVQLCFCFNSVWLRSLDILSDLFIEKQRLRCAWKLPCKHVSLSWVFFFFWKKTFLFSFQEPKKQRKKLVTWSIEEVCSWLISLDLELYCESFRQNAIDGVELSNMTGEVLASDLGIGEEHVRRSFAFILTCL